MTSWDDVAAGLLRTAATVDADVRFRVLVLQQQCQKLENTYEHLRGLERALDRKQSTQHAETLVVQQSIQDAIRRARQVRAELAAGSADAESEEEQENAEEQQLQGILAVARATRAVEAEKAEEQAAEQPRLKIEYPRKLKALESQLKELHDKEQHASVRFAFCCKVNEHLSLRPERRQLIRQQQERTGANARLEVPVMHIQVSFSKQEARLRRAYELLMEFMREKVEVQSPRLVEVASAPTFSTVFPLYHRLKQARKMLRLLNSEAKAFMERAPSSPPRLSTAARTHRDAVLARIRRKRPQSKPGAVDNEALLAAARASRSPLDVDAEVWNKLQVAWSAHTSTKAAPLCDAYSSSVRELVLTELSNAVLWSFKTNFAERSEPPDAQHVEAVMRLVRLVDSVALSRGRTYRSIVAS